MAVSGGNGVSEIKEMTKKRDSVQNRTEDNKREGCLVPVLH